MMMMMMMIIMMMIKYDQAQPRGSDAVAVAIKAAKTATMVRVVVPIMCDPIM